MSTRSVIGYETQTGSYVGVYCHFDGYKSHMMPQLEEMSWAAVKCEVDKALYEKAGCRELKDHVMKCYDEQPDPARWGYTVWDDSGSAPLEFNYRKRLDGAVDVVY